MNPVCPDSEQDFLTLLVATEKLAETKADGQLSIMRFTTGWKCFLGTPHFDFEGGRAQLEAIPLKTSLKEALLHVLTEQERIP